MSGQAKPFELSFPKALLKQVVELTLVSKLDAVGRLTVALSTRKNAVIDKGIPKDVEVQVEGQLAFKGHLVGMERIRPFLTEYYYEDELRLLDLDMLNVIFKPMQLRTLLSQCAQRASLSTQFQGDFTDEVPAFQSRSTTLDLLRELSDQYGFFFRVNPKGQLQFIRAGNSLAQKSLDASKDIIALACEIKSTSMILQAEQSGLNESLERTVVSIPDGEIKQSINTFTSSLFGEKASWKLGKRSAEGVCPSPAQLKSIAQKVKSQIGKKLMKQDTTVLRKFGVSGVCGDLIDLSSKKFGEAEGKYLVHDVVTRIRSSRPVHELNLVRP